MRKILTLLFLAILTISNILGQNNFITGDDTISIGQNTILTATVSNTNASPCAASSLPTNLQTGLIGYWAFCGNANDLSGNGNHGTVSGATLSSDRFGNPNCAYSFDGVNDLINCGNSTIFNMNTFTISAWYFQTVYPTPGDANSIVSKATWLAGEIGYRMDVQTDNNEYFVWSRMGIVVSGTGFASSPTKSPLNQWVNLIVVKNGSTAILYRNGVEVDVVSGLTANVNNNQNLLIGAIVDQGITQDFFDGKIDDIAIWNRALTPQDVNSVYNIGNTTDLAFEGNDSLMDDELVNLFETILWENAERMTKISREKIKDEVIALYFKENKSQDEIIEILCEKFEISDSKERQDLTFVIDIIIRKSE